MTQDEILKLAREAGIYHAFDSEGHWDGLTDVQLIERHPPHPKTIVYSEKRVVEILERFAKLVAQAEREALEGELLKLKKGIAANSDYIQGRWDLIGEFQDVIRARGQA